MNIKRILIHSPPVCCWGHSDFSACCHTWEAFFISSTHCNYCISVVVGSWFAALGRHSLSSPTHCNYCISVVVGSWFAALGRHSLSSPTHCNYCISVVVGSWFAALGRHSLSFPTHCNYCISVGSRFAALGRHSLSPPHIATSLSLSIANLWQMMSFWIMVFYFLSVLVY